MYIYSKYRNSFIIYLLASCLYCLPGNLFAQSSYISRLSENKKLELDRAFYEGNRQMALGNKNLAEDAFRQCISILPQHAASYYMLGVISRDKHDFQQALVFLEAAIKYDSDNKWYYDAIAHVYGARQEYAEAAENYLKMAELDEEDVESLDKAASMYALASAYKKAIATYNRIEKKKGLAEETSVAKEQMYFKLKQPDKAIKEIKRLSNAELENNHYLGMLGEVYMDAGMENDAVAIYEKILLRDPSNGLAHFALSDYYESKGNAERSFEELKKAFSDKNLSLKIKLPEFLKKFQFPAIENHKIAAQLEELAQILEKTHPMDAMSYRVHADLLHQTNQLQQAREKYEQSLQFDKSSQEVYTQLIDIDLKLRDNAKTAAHSLEAMELFPNFTGFFYYNAAANIQLKNYKQAIKAASQGIETAPGDPEVLIQLFATIGDAAYFEKEYKLSDSAYEQALFIDSNNIYVLNNYAYFLSVQGRDLSKAERMSKRTVDKNPGSSTYLDTYGWVLYKMGRYTDAEKYIRMAVEADPGMSEVEEHLGDVLWKLGRKEDALKQWEKAKAAGSGSEFLDQKIAGKKLVE